MPSFISDEDCSWPPIREHEGNIVFDIHTAQMITDYIGGEGSAETPKNDYVIYG